MALAKWAWWRVAGAALITSIATLFAQVPGQAPGQGPSPPPLHIPHIGGSRQARPEPEVTPGSRVYVVLWFNVQDYIRPQSDDAAKRLAVFLTEQGIPATFNVVGEKARVLKQRQRQDVISAIAQHEVGYNSNTHSQHPTVAEYESTLAWDPGVEEFTRRERAGFDDVARIFQKTPLVYAQPGGAWAPQAFPALQKWGVRTYLGESKQVGLRGRMFWYGGLLNIFNIRQGQQLRPNADWSNLEMAKARFQDMYLALSSRKSGGLISIGFRPCDFVDQESWDEVNFRDGANPAGNELKLPPVRTAQETENAFQYFEGLVRYIKSFPQVQFLSASGVAARYRDRAQMHVFSPQEMGAIASQVDSDVTFQEGDTFNLSAIEVFFIINKFLVGILRKQASGPLFLDRTPFGPSAESPPLTGNVVVPWIKGEKALISVQEQIEKTGQIPNAINIAGQIVPPESYLVGIARVVQSVLQNAQFPESVTFVPARLAAADYVGDDSPDLWDWDIFPRGFHAPKLMSLAKLQAWTLKPAK